MGEGRAEPRTAYAVLYAPTTEGRRAQRGATGRSEFKKYFSINFILTIFLFNNHKFVFCFGFWAEGLGVNAQNPKLLILFEGGARGELKGWIAPTENSSLYFCVNCFDKIFNFIIWICLFPIFFRHFIKNFNI